MGLGAQPYSEGAFVELSCGASAPGGFLSLSGELGIGGWGLGIRDEDLGFRDEGLGVLGQTGFVSMFCTS